MKRNVSIDFIRVVSCLAVVFLHTVAIFWYMTPIKLLTTDSYNMQMSEYLANNMVLSTESCSWYICSLLDAITRFSVPCFVMISGALILNRDHVHLDYSWKKTRYVAKIIFAWGSICALLYAITCIVFKETILISSLLQSLMTGGGLFWYLYMLLPLYFASPIFRIIVSNKDATISFLILWIGFSIIFPFVQVLIPSLADRIYFEYLKQFSVYSGYFVIGGLLYNKIIKYNIKRVIERKDTRVFLIAVGGGIF